MVATAPIPAPWVVELAAAANDVNMLVCTGGRQRSEARVSQPLRRRRIPSDARHPDAGGIVRHRGG
jgi:hypothetical protein